MATEQQDEAAKPKIPPTLRHPVEWRAEKKTVYTNYALGMALAWHQRCRAGVEAFELDDPSSPPYAGPVVDPHGEEVRAMSEATYDVMITAAITLQRQLRADEAKRPGGKSSAIRVLPHPDLNHAIVVRVPAGALGVSLINEIEKVRETGLDPRIGAAGVVAPYIVWPSGADQQELSDRLSLAFHEIYLDGFLSLLGMRGVGLKKRVYTWRTVV